MWSKPAAERRRYLRGTVQEPGRRELIAAILGSFKEMPGLRLRLAQAARFFGIRLPTCQIVLNELVHQGHLRRAPDGQYSL
jgi:DNA-binding IclR family transcriptional regulator